MYFRSGWWKTLKRRVYKNLDCLVLLEDHSVIGQAVLTSNLQIGLSHTPSSSQQTMNYTVEQGQVELQSNSDHTTISLPLAYTGQQDSPTAVSMPESFHGMQAFNSTLASSFLVSDPSSSIYPGDYDWGSNDSIVTRDDRLSTSQQQLSVWGTSVTREWIVSEFKCSAGVS